MDRLVILCFLLFNFTITGGDRISINCSGGAAVSDRKWGGDAATKGSSKASTVTGELITAVDPVPYVTARISRSQFSYSLHLVPGQKFIRLHFNPTHYCEDVSMHAEPLELNQESRKELDDCKLELAVR
ncbi:hypothetical protein SASPL_134780 [Salvia splendens]|uniref:Uncharacterized protein n=1 Tax=Salvia splendens TaxID=180675 RepID=A0A8X8ZFC1_SALSN|nr:hypothetical protein SASPL_134780 [Salvia splendens]